MAITFFAFSAPGAYNVITIQREIYMKDYRILQSVEDVYYIKSVLPPNDSHVNFPRFEKRQGEDFLSYLSQLTEPHKQAGYSRTMECSFLAVVAVMFTFSDDKILARCLGIYAKVQYITQKNNQFEWVDAREHQFYHLDGINCQTSTMYHPLPDGKLMEIKGGLSPQDASWCINKERLVYTLDEKLLEKNVETRRPKI